MTQSPACGRSHGNAAIPDNATACSLSSPPRMSTRQRESGPARVTMTHCGAGTARAVCWEQCGRREGVGDESAGGPNDGVPGHIKNKGKPQQPPDRRPDGNEPAMRGENPPRPRAREPYIKLPAAI